MDALRHRQYTSRRICPSLVKQHERFGGVRSDDKNANAGGHRETRKETNARTGSVYTYPEATRL